MLQIYQVGASAMRAFFTTLALGGALLCGAGAWAATQVATVEPVQGELFINHGKGFEKVASKIEVKVGDSLMVNPNGIAKVTYPDGCQANVKPGAVTTIAKLSPCASGSLAAELPIYKAQPAVAPAPVCGFWCGPWWLLGGLGLLAIPNNECNSTLYHSC
jgi:hypothetical protein